MKGRKYTSTDKDGIRWRWDGLRPVSEIADKAFDDFRKKMLHAAWLLTRPKAVQELAAIYPVGTKFQIHERVMFTVGYSEQENGAVGVLVSPIDIELNYDKAIAGRELVCGCCLPRLKELLIP